MTHRPRSHVLEARSRDRVRAVFHEFGFVVDDLHEDYGEDMLVRVFRDGRATPYSFYVQVKAQERSSVGRVPSVRVSRRHAEHWARLTSPVLLVLWTAADDVLIWESVRHALRAYRGDKTSRTMSLRLPPENRLDGDGIRRIANIARESHDMLAREREGGRVLCSALEEHSKMRIREYSPRDEVLILNPPSGGALVYFFGNLAQVIGRAGRGRRRSLGEQLKKRILEESERAKKSILRRGGKILYLDDDGNVIHSFASREEQRFFNRVNRERYDIPDYLDEQGRAVGPSFKRPPR